LAFEFELGELINEATCRVTHEHSPFVSDERYLIRDFVRESSQPSQACLAQEDPKQTFARQTLQGFIGWHLRGK
jgi:hypothetical protein